MKALSASAGMLALAALAAATGHPPLWDDSRPLLKAVDLPVLEGVEFHLMKWNNNSGELAVIPVDELRAE